MTTTANPELFLSCDKTITIMDLLNYAIVQKLRTAKAADEANATADRMERDANFKKADRYAERYKAAERIIADLFFNCDCEAAGDLLDFAELYLFNEDKYDEYTAEQERKKNEHAQQIADAKRLASMNGGCKSATEQTLDRFRNHAAEEEPDPWETDDPAEIAAEIAREYPEERRRPDCD